MRAVWAMAALAFVACRKSAAPADDEGAASWDHVVELAAPLSTPGEPDLLDSARVVAHEEHWRSDRAYRQMDGVITLLKQWRDVNGGIRPARMGNRTTTGVDPFEYQELVHPIASTTKDPAVLEILDVLGRRFLEQGRSLMDNTVGIMIQREVHVRAKQLKLPHTIDRALWRKSAVRIVAAEAVAMQARRAAPTGPQPSTDSVLDAEANIGALTDALSGVTLDDDITMLVTRLRAQPAERAATKELLGLVIDQLDDIQKQIAELSN